MSKTNTNANNGQNRNQNSRRGGQGKGASNGSSRGDCRNGRGNNLITKYSFEGKIKDGLLSNLTINETGYRPSQFKKICNALPVFYADKNYQSLDEVLSTKRDKVKDGFMPDYPDATQWSTIHHVQIVTVNPEADLVESNGEPLVHYQIMK